MKYKSGDKVVIRRDLKLGVCYYMEDRVTSDTVIEEMLRFAGKIVTIKEVFRKKYFLKENNWNWTDEMFQYKQGTTHQDAFFSEANAWKRTK